MGTVKVKDLLSNVTREQSYSDPVDEARMVDGKYYPSKTKFTLNDTMDIGASLNNFPVGIRPQSTDEKLAELVKLAETGKTIRETGFNRDLSGDAYFADVMRGNYITSTGGQGQAAPRATQAPAFQPPIAPEKLNLLERGMRLREAGGAEQVQASQAQRELADKRFNEMRQQWTEGMDFKKKGQQMADLLSHKRLKQGDRSLTLQQKRFIDSFKQNDRKMDILAGQFEKQFGLSKDRFQEQTRVNTANIANAEEIRAQAQQRINLEDFRLQKSLEDKKYIKARTLLKDGIASGKSEEEMLNLLQIMGDNNFLDKPNLEVLKRILHEPTKWERFKEWLFGK
ncbi:MAG: hypothetical protein U9O94_00490 [Nanoarchaeota archaeon]|nr:hypothetical protein [Nanoarchaeota archaeon]